MVCQIFRWNTLKGGALIATVFKSFVFTHLLIKQSPEHWQWDVEHQNPQHHLNLLDQMLLLTHKYTDLLTDYRIIDALKPSSF